jgi:hypothetical protein
MELTNILEYPLSLAFLIYLTTCTIILYTRPTFLFSSSSKKINSEDTPTTQNDDFSNSNKNLWLFFILLAIIIYVLISLLVSHVNRTNYLALFTTTSPKD